MLPQSDTEAFLWAKRAADAGLAKAMYAVGYFYEVAIGTPPNQRQCVSYTFRLVWLKLTKNTNRASSMYEKAAKLGDTRAADRLNGIVAGRVANEAIVQRDGGDGNGEVPRHKDKDGCVIM